MMRWLKIREVRKFLRSKLAVVSLMIIGAYLAVAGWVLAGGISLADTERRAGVSSLPGFGIPARPSVRMDQNYFVVERVSTALARPSGPQRQESLDLGVLRLAERPDPELASIAEACRTRLNLLGQAQTLDTPAVRSELSAIEGDVRALFANPDDPTRRFELFLGTDRQGRSILLRTLYSVRVAFLIGFVTSVISVLFGSLLGAAAAFFGGWVDLVVIWLYSTFSSVPNLVLLAVLAYTFTGSRFEKTLIPVYAAFCMTFWIGPCRVVRGEVLKIKELEYVQAATAVGFSRFFILARHVIPNTAHLLFINFSLLFIGAIKSEVILSFLNLGVKEGPSWGIMISQASSEVLKGFFWQIGAATFFMFGLVLAFNIVSDTLQDAFDPRHV